MLPYYLCLAFSVVAGAAGQVMLKIGALNQVKNSSMLFFEKYTLLGLLVYFIAAIAYIYSLRRVPLTFAFPSVSLSYFFVSLAAHLILGESFTSMNIVALALISAGIFLLAI
jgi:small multidrug resistance pump